MILGCILLQGKWPSSGCDTGLGQDGLGLAEAGCDIVGTNIVGTGGDYRSG